MKSGENRGAHSLMALALVCGACQPRPSEPRSAGEAAKPGEAARPAERSEGELRAERVSAHAVGTPGPALTLETIDGEQIDLAKLYGHKPVYLKFWATWCVPCRKQMPGFERIFETAGDRMAVIAVNAGLDDDADAVRAFRKEHGLRMPIVVDDGRLAAALDLQVTPQHVLIGKDAKITYVGHEDGVQLDAAIQRVLADPAPPAPAVGRAVDLRPAFRTGEVVQGLAARTMDGTVVALGASASHRPRALVLFSTWCEDYLETSLPRTSQACRRVREEVDPLIGDGGVDWLGIAQGLWTSPESVTEYRDKTHTRLPLALDADGSLFRAFGVHQMPTVVLIDGDGRLVRVLGPEDRDLTAAVRALAAGTPAAAR